MWISGCLTLLCVLWYNFLVSGSLNEISEVAEYTSLVSEGSRISSRGQPPEGLEATYTGHNSIEITNFNGLARIVLSAAGKAINQSSRRRLFHSMNHLK